jgi:pyruvate dehydrogenase E2 component (dihydrolipoamide acetyltransferase)
MVQDKGEQNSMETKVIIPQMGESVVECTLTKWLKKVGDPIVSDEPLYEISSDKVDSEIPSPASGTLSEILVPEGKTVKINTVVAVILDIDEKKKSSLQAEIASVSGPAIGFVSEAEKKSSEETPLIHFLEQRAAPIVRKIAREENIDLAKVTGTGLEGRITKEDVLSYIASRAASTRLEVSVDSIPLTTVLEDKIKNAEGIQSYPILQPTREQNSIAVPRFLGEIETVPMTPMRKAIASHMVFSKKVSAHVNTVFEVDVSSLVRLREDYKTEFQERDGIPLTYTPFFAKALIDTIREFPIFNASVSEDSIIYKKPINLGIAVAIDSGLIVPVIRDAHLKNFSGIALAIHDLAERARTKRLKPDDVQNGTVTLTNPGIYGPLFETPIINQPQVAILSIGGIAKRPVVINDAIAIRSIVYLSLTFDHRIIDGAVADQFMASLKKKLQTWTQGCDL